MTNGFLLVQWLFEWLEALRTNRLFFVFACCIAGSIDRELKVVGLVVCECTTKLKMSIIIWAGCVVMSFPVFGSFSHSHQHGPWLLT